MGQKHTETEVKIKVVDLAEIERKLQALQAVLNAPRVYERNVRYEDANNTLSRDERILRLRQDTRARLTYKEPHEQSSSNVNIRTELEVEVSDFETMDLLLKKLGYHEAWIYEKYRTTYNLDACEIVLDELPYGAFIEVEGTPDNIERVLSTLGLQDESRITASYSVLFFQIKDRLKLPFRDLTFENFKGITLSGNILL
jgi:adenylate cyclase class 2